jgi:hypothetical protein
MSAGWARTGAWVVVVVGVAVAAGVVPGAEPGAPDLSGRWKLNKDLSQPDPKGDSSAATTGRDTPASDGEADEHGERGGARRGPTSPLPASDTDEEDPRGAKRTEPVAELTIRQSETEIVVEETPGATQRFYPNGKTYKTDEGASDIKSEWKGGALVVEKKNRNGWRLVQTWHLAPDGRRLTLDLHFEGGKRPRLTLRRVYDRVVSDP